jgi:GNAT superfamily N-acetyltransferase
MLAMHVARARLESTEAQTLIAALNQELAVMYPEEGANHFGLSEDDVAPGNGCFVVLRDEGGAPVACGAVRKLDGERAELKRMYVVPEARGRRFGERVLATLEDEARALGARRLVLETGVRQVAALRLYHRAGYEPTPPWGEYLDSPLSVCLEKRLV